MSLIRKGLWAVLWLPGLIIANRAQAWNANASADISGPFVQGDPVMSFSGSFTWPLTKIYSLSVGQGLEKNLYVDSETREFELSDTSLSFNINPRSLIPKVGWTIRLIMTLPTSYSSQYNEVYSKPEARWGAAMPVTETFNLALSAFMRYTLSRYKTGKTQDLSGGGPIPEVSYGIGHSGNWTVRPDWTLTYGANYAEIRYHDVAYQGAGDPALFNQADQSFSLFVSASWNITAADSVSVSYSYGGILLQPGLDDYVLYDKEISRWSVGYVRSFQSQ